jgi:hypothetical protein
MQARIARVGRTASNAAERALRIEGERIMTRSKQEFVPVDLGALRASGHVQEPTRRGKDVEVVMAYGGPAAPYALIQHENPDFRHRVGQWKYLEQPMREAEPGMADRLAKALSLERL